MLEFLELLVWIAEIASLNIESMTPAKRAICVVIYGALGLLFAGAGLIPLLGEEPRSGLAIFGGLIVSMIGVGFLARIAYGLLALRRLNRGST
jgi:hypothetical protein